MKSYQKELVALLIQLFMFYIFPLFAGPRDAIGMVLLIVIATLLLSAVLGAVSDNRIKWLYPISAAILFVPSVFIYYNESALVHAVWYLVASAIGLCVGALVRAVFLKLK